MYVILKLTNKCLVILQIFDKINIYITENEEVPMQHFPFKIHSDYSPQGDQPEAIKSLVKALMMARDIKLY